MFHIRSLFAFLVFVAFGGLIQARSLSETTYNELSILSSRQAEKPPPCDAPTGNVDDSKGVKDDGSSVAQSTNDEVARANFRMVVHVLAERKKNGEDITVKSDPKKRWNPTASFEGVKKLVKESLFKRVNGNARTIHETAKFKVPTDGSGLAWYVPKKGEQNFKLDDQIISTNDLSGCTVGIIASPYATIMIHVWERRANKNGAWVLDHQGSDQQEEDAEFVAKGNRLATQMLRKFPGSVADGYNGWFPADKTKVVIIAPGANDEYGFEEVLGGVNPEEYDFGDLNDPENTAMELDSIGLDPNAMALTAEELRELREQTQLPAPPPKKLMNPWYTKPNVPSNPLQLIYPNGAAKLQDELAKLVIPGKQATQSEIRSYRRRYARPSGPDSIGDPKHGTDDREFISVVVHKSPVDGTTVSYLLYDDDKGAMLAKLR